uniref:OTU domain-containing protein n=1 Tax=Leptocylindrus danicus TaxID=163516 RepID=A0A7S2PB71_9STRA|mmetsp:Transcript_2833/g.4061  ORF Transcript_2833/g.4061 Transcript_2833/m.4061 type:complete len:400 (+) Transcript_2833:77-1276(+)|eukprot:CAMPEP_0116011928 /NCGR_PEP_ID=MMETSP0321-20121206/4838_1 /TAXON_ID=163516 /ORGANISM="Leptocylindrus danicus var. danicus, Strain B650" /LENGTH=399 /DNA_ID=CAMNT_0003481211 /DNA_START=73 /DNA_END=1272 /DNA_ORIENTATION=-
MAKDHGPSSARRHHYICRTSIIFLLVILTVSASIPRSTPHSRYTRFFADETDDNNDGQASSSSTVEEDEDAVCPPWNASPNIDPSGFLKDCYTVRCGAWEGEADLNGRHGYRRLHKRAAAAGNVDDDADYLQNLEIGKFRVRQVPGDGNCLFHSLSLCLHYAERQSHFPLKVPESFRELFRRSKKLRNTAVQILQQSTEKGDKLLFMQGQEFLTCSELLSAAASQYNISPEEYCEAMLQDCTWGGGPEIVALVNALRRPIHVYELSVHEELPNGSNSKEFHLSRMACFGSPKFDKREPLHILSADSRFPDITPGRQKKSGNHFLALFPVRSATFTSTSSLVRGGKTNNRLGFKGKRPRHDSAKPGGADSSFCLNNVALIVRSAGEFVELLFCSLCNFLR